MHRAAAPPQSAPQQRLRRSGNAAGNAAQRAGRAVKPSRAQSVGADGDGPAAGGAPLQILDPRELPSADDIHVVTEADFGARPYISKGALQPARSAPL